VRRLVGRLGQNSIICGHFGSGKTNVSVGLSLAIAAAGYRCALVDLDIVNPYFRAADAALILKDAGVECIVPQYANTNLDLPALGGEIFSVFARGESDPGCYAVFDVGGSEGAGVLGRYLPYLRQQGCSVICVVNMYRPLTSMPETAAADLRETEALSGLRVTHIINNSNLGRETSSAHIEESLEYTREISRLIGAGLLYTTMHSRIFCDALSRKYPDMTFCTLPDSTRRLF
jgi:hypothetical protein